MSLSTTYGIPDVPDGLTLYTDGGDCKLGCYIEVGLSNATVASGTINQADFLNQMYAEQCYENDCYGSVGTTWGTESYYNGTNDYGDTQPYWFEADFTGHAYGDARKEQFLNIVKETLLGTLRNTGMFNDLTACQDGVRPGLDPDASFGCNPHENRYGIMSAEMHAKMWSVDRGVPKGSLWLIFDLEKKGNGFCDLLQGLGDAMSIAPFGDGASTAIGAANYLVSVACS